MEINKVKYDDYERDNESRLDYMGARYRNVEATIPLSTDRFWFKTPHLSPYNFAANNPVNYIDVNGDSVWFSQYDDDITMHVRGKLINTSSDNINTKRAASDIIDGISDTFSGNFKLNGQKYNLKTDVQIDAVNSMSQVESSDHLFVIIDDSGGKIYGAVNQIGGKVINLRATDYRNDNWFSNNFMQNSIRTAMHEFGHALGLGHTLNSLNLMTQGTSFSFLSPKQRMDILFNRNNINRGQNWFRDVSGIIVPYPYVIAPNGEWDTAKRLLNRK